MIKKNQVGPHWAKMRHVESSEAKTDVLWKTLLPHYGGQTQQFKDPISEVG